MVKGMQAKGMQHANKEYGTMESIVHRWGLMCNPCNACDMPVVTREGHRCAVRTS